MTTSTCNNLQPDHSSSGADSTTATATVAVTAAAAATAAPAAVVLVIGNPEAPEFSLLQQLPAGAVLLGLGQTLADFAHLSPEQWASCDVLVRETVLFFIATCASIYEAWLELWMHTQQAV
jgi:hypothetical protein